MANATAIIPATVRIVDLPLGGTLTGVELLEAVQTVGGVGNSVQISINQIATSAFGALPVGGATGQFLQKNGLNNFSATWANVASNVLASTGLAQSGSTTVSLSLASTAGLSVLGVGAAGSAVPAPITGTADQVFIVNHAGSSALFGAVNLATSAAVTGVLAGANMSAVNLASTGAGGVQGLLPPADIASTGGAAGQILAINPAGTTVEFVTGMVLLNTLSPNNVSVAADTTSLTATFRNYMFTFENVCPAGSATLGMQVATSGGFASGSTYVSMNQVITSATVYQTAFTTSILLSGNNATTTVSTSIAYGMNGFVKMFNPASSTFRKQVVGQMTYLAAAGASGTTTIAQCMLNGYWDGASSPITGVQFLFNSFNIQTGTIRVYGF